MKISTFNLGKIRILLTYVLIANALFIILDFPQAIEGLFSSNLKDLRDSTYVEFELPWWNNPVLGILKRLTTAFDPILLFLSVFGFVYDREKKIYKFGMIIYVLNIIKLMGLLGSRGAISFFLIDCILLYILFYPLLSTVVRKKILLIALLCSFGFGSFISAMTYARFTDSNTSSEAVNEAISSSMLLYLGESGINFMGSMYEKESTLLYGYDMFPLFRRLLGLEYIGSDREKATIYFEQATNTRAFIFYQLTGSLYSNFGKYGTFLILLFFNIYLNRLVTRKKNFSIISFLSIFFYSSIIAKGVFYYALKTEGGNLSYVLILTLFLYFIKEKIKNGKKSENLIKNIGLK
jgi:oligosaccharide repeat unit polymerase